MLRLRTLAIGTFALAFAVALAPAGASQPVQLSALWSKAAQPNVAPDSKRTALRHLKHLIFIIQENRSFDSYFGTYPGADGFPSPLPCLPSTFYPSECFTPYADHSVRNRGGPYDVSYQLHDIDNGLMDGFVEQRERELEAEGCTPPAGIRRHSPQELKAWRASDDDEGIPNDDPPEPACIDDVMGYHDGTDLPNYWAYAQNYVLLDHFFESIHSKSNPAHLAAFSGWAASCTELNPPNVQSCVGTPDPRNIWGTEFPTPYLWTDITYLLFQHNISWGVYLDGGQGPLGSHCCVIPIWNVLPGFQDVQVDGQVSNALLNQTQFYTDAANGTLPQVTWLLPKYFDSEHPQAHIDDGQAYTTGLVNAVMSGPDWKDSAIFISHDDMGGFYDHVPPPIAFDTLGIGIRLPAMLISPYAKQGYIDHEVCSTDCYIRLIEDVFLKSERMDQAGRPDPRPDYRDEQNQYNDFEDDFDFKQTPRRPLLLPTHPMSLLREGPPQGPPPSAIHKIAHPPR